MARKRREKNLNSHSQAVSVQIEQHRKTSFNDNDSEQDDTRSRRTPLEEEETLQQKTRHRSFSDSALQSDVGHLYGSCSMLVVVSPFSGKTKPLQLCVCKQDSIDIENNCSNLCSNCADENKQTNSTTRNRFSLVKSKIAKFEELSVNEKLSQRKHPK